MNDIQTVGNALVRDTNTGRFLAGNSGNGGRRKGARSRLGESFLSKLADHFEQHGSGALDRLATTEPESYLRIVAALVPRVGDPVDYGDMDDEQLQEAYDRAKRSKQVKAVFDAEQL